MEGAGTLMDNVLDLIGSMILEVELQTNTSLILAEYFSMVLLKAAWASLVMDSASFMTTTLNFFLFGWCECEASCETKFVKSILSTCATSFNKS
ncbi:unnamed protein product [Ambrosiozyma monospora]|uniref:Unnamed protein product n=1 Tax=Ambrosiozyma monospora TaxID=43982 RepID=A0ACB5UDR8_AMBMO|nr:unnamed protein product [Ambrosiozyma monospora]